MARLYSFENKSPLHFIDELILKEFEEVVIIRMLVQAITLLRMLLSLALFMVKPFSELFFCLYLLCGASDVLDGYLARKAGVAGRMGAVLDSVADVVFFSCMLIILLPMIGLDQWIFIWMAVILLLHAGSIIVNLFRYRKVVFLHTYANKIAGVVLFAFPFFAPIIGSTVMACLVCVIATYAAIEELAISAIGHPLSADVKGLFL